MILFKAPQGYYYNHNNVEMIVPYSHMLIRKVNSTKAFITVKTDFGYGGTDKLITVKIPVEEILDINGFPYGTQFGELVIALNAPVGTTIEDHTEINVDYYMSQELNDVSFAVAPVKGDNVFELNAGHGIVNASGNDRDFLNLYYRDDNLQPVLGRRFTQFAVVAIDGNTISVTPPIPHDVNLSNIQSFKRVSLNMAVVGSFASPQLFQIYPNSGVIWNIKKFVLDFILSAAGDDSKFGGGDPLANGLYFSADGDAGAFYTLAFFDNADFRASTFELEYIDRSQPQAEYGMAVNKDLSNTTASLRLKGDGNDKFFANIQDDLTDVARGILRFRVRILGRQSYPTGI